MEYVSKTKLVHRLIQTSNLKRVGNGLNDTSIVTVPRVLIYLNPESN